MRDEEASGTAESLSGPNYAKELHVIFPDPDAMSKNATFFNDNDRYMQSVSQLETYANIRRELASALHGTTRLLDIGNGGVFDYPLDVAEEIVGVDLFVGEAASARLPPHVTLVKGDANNLPSELGTFDTVAMIMLIHHVVGAQVSDQAVLLRHMFTGLQNVMTDAARLVIVESIVSSSFYSFERLAYPIAYKWLTRREGGHPPVTQLSLAVLLELLSEQFDITKVKQIPVGRTLLQFGRRFPSMLSPARPVLIEARPR